MANLSKTITNSIQSFGPAPSTKWGSGSPYTMTWGASLWGEGTQDLPVYMTKGISNGVSVADAVALSILYTMVISESFSLTSETVSETLQSGGYYYVFAGPVTDAENRSRPTYASGSVTAPSWTTLTASDITWS